MSEEPGHGDGRGRRRSGRRRAANSSTLSRQLGVVAARPSRKPGRRHRQSSRVPLRATGETDLLQDVPHPRLFVGRGRWRIRRRSGRGRSSRCCSSASLPVVGVVRLGDQRRSGRPLASAVMPGGVISRASWETTTSKPGLAIVGTSGTCSGAAGSLETARPLQRHRTAPAAVLGARRRCPPPPGCRERGERLAAAGVGDVVDASSGRPRPPARPARRGSGRCRPPSRRRWAGRGSLPSRLRRSP